jgi:hypothetical protein
VLWTSLVHPHLVVAGP